MIMLHYTQSELYYSGEGKGMTFCEFSWPTPYTKKMLFRYSQYQILVILRFSYTKMHFRDPHYQKSLILRPSIQKYIFETPNTKKWHFWDSWYKKCIFETPPHKNRDPHTFFMFFHPIQNGPSFKLVKIYHSPHI